MASNPELLLPLYGYNIIVASIVGAMPCARPGRFVGTRFIASRPARCLKRASEAYYQTKGASIDAQ